MRTEANSVSACSSIHCRPVQVRGSWERMAQAASQRISGVRHCERSAICQLIEA